MQEVLQVSDNIIDGSDAGLILTDLVQLSLLPLCQEGCLHLRRGLVKEPLRGCCLI